MEYLNDVSGLDFVIIRTDSAGVHMGYLKEEKPNNSGHYAVTLHNTRRIWSWSGANSISELAATGTDDAANCKFSIAISQNKLMAIEILKVSDEGKKNLESVPVWVFKKEKK